MRSKQAIILLALALVSAGGAYWAGRGYCGRCGQRGECWIGEHGGKAAKMQQELNEQVLPMISELSDLRSELYAIIGDPCEPDSVVRGKQEQINKVHHELVRTIFENIAQMRDVLPEDQKQQLIDTCSQLLEQPKFELSGQHRYGQMGSKRHGHGNGMGRGMQRRGRGFAQRLELDPEQQQTFRTIDPDFKSQAATLTHKLLDQMDVLRGLIANETTPAAQIMEEVDDVLQTHSELESLTLEHLLKIKPYLRPGQNDMLRSMCKRYPRENQMQ